MEKQTLETILSDISSRCPDTISGDLNAGYVVHAGLKMQISFKNGDFATDMLAEVISIMSVNTDVLCLKGERRQIKYLRLSDVTLISVTERENVASTTTDARDGTGSGAGFLR